MEPFKCLLQAFDDVVRKEKPKEDVFEYKKRLTLDHEKSKQSLAQIYEQEYLKQNQVCFLKIIISFFVFHEFWMFAAYCKSSLISE